MYPVSSGPVVGAMMQALWMELRHLLAYLGWILAVGFAGAAGCWSCGYVAREVWLKAGPPRRRSRADVEPDGSGGDDAVRREAARGIREIEEFLATIGGSHRGDVR